MSKIAELFLEAESSPTSYEKWLDLGRYAVDRYVTSIGLEAMKKAADRAPTNPEVLDYYARVLNRARRLDKAAAVYRRAIEIDPNRPSLWTGYGVVLGHLGQREKIENCCTRALEIDPGYAWAAFVMIPVLGLSGRIAQILPILKNAIAANPGSSQLWMSYSDMLSMMGDASGSEIAFTEALSKVETSPPDEQRRSLSSMMKGPRGEVAIEVARKIVKEDPDNLGVYGPIVMWCIENDLDEGKRLLEHAFHIDPNNSSLKPEAAQLLMKSGDYKGAKSIIDSIRRDMPDSPVADALELTIREYYTPADDASDIVEVLQMYLNSNKAAKSLTDSFELDKHENRKALEWDVTRKVARGVIDDVRGLYSTTVWHLYFDLLSKEGWPRIRDRMVSTLKENTGSDLFNARVGILDSLSMVELSGFDGDLAPLILSAPDSSNKNEIGDYIYDQLVALIKTQIEKAGPTLFLDVERLSQTAGASLIPSILDNRQREMREVKVRVTTDAIDLRQLWLTSYGYDILSGLDFGLETDAIGLKKLDSVLDSAGFKLNTETSDSVIGDEELTNVSDTLRSFVFSHAMNQLNNENEDEK